MHPTYLNAAVFLLLAALIAAPPSWAQTSDERVDALLQTALALDSDPKQGAIIYRENCVGCHGPAALGDAKRVVPALAGQRQAYLIKQLADFAEHERDSGFMHGVVNRPRLKKPQVWVDVAAYLNALPVAGFREQGDGSKVELGEGIFREQCASCHLEDARGDDDGFVPSLRNQHYSYLIKQMRGLAEGHRRNVDVDFIRFIDSLDPEERSAVADYLSRFGGPTLDRLKMRANGVVGD